MNLRKSMLAACAAGMTLSAFAQASVETRAFYSTNADGAVGKSATITIDGSFADWSEDMIIATCGANDMCTTFKGSHENCVIDAYALYAAWDDSNLYLAWQMVNTGDTWAREGDGPLTDGGRIGDVPFIVALSVDPTKTAMSGLLENGNALWCDSPGHGVTFDREKVHVSNLFFMSGKAGQGEPTMYVASNASGATNYGAASKSFKSLGITYAMAEGFQPSHLWRQRTCADWADATTLISDPSIYLNIYDADNYDNLMAGEVEGLKPHDTKYDSFYEMQIPFSAIGIDRAWLEANGIGVRVIGTRGESGIDCIPHDPSMVDNIFEEYAKDPSTSGEKDDTDVITYALADIAKVRDLSQIVPPEPDPDPDPDPTPDPTDPIRYADEQCVFFEGDWSPVNIWIWSDGANYTVAGVWPGDAMTSLGNNVYKWSYSKSGTLAEKTSVIFNNGSTQSDEFEYVNGGYYTISGMQKVIPASEEINPDPTPDPDPDPDPDPEPGDGFDVYFDNSVAGWATPHIYYWNISSPTYPGVAMNPYKDNVWVYRVPAGTTGILFNAGDGDATKTGDMTPVADHIYDQTGDKGLYDDASVAGIQVEMNEARYFNLQGIEVTNPEHGIFIVRTANSVRKVMIP